MKQVMVLLLVGGAVLAAYRASHPPETMPSTAAASVAALTATTASAKLVARAGRLGSHLAGPFVHSWTKDTERLLAEVAPLIAKAKARDAKRARDLSARILATDSAAIFQLEGGHPIAALKLAFNARGLIPAVRQTVAEERAFQ